MSSIRESASTEIKLQIVREAHAAGSRVVGVLDIEVGQRDRLGTNLSMFFGGSIGIRSAQVFELDTQGVRHLYVQPFSDVVALPGEHHVWLWGSIRSPVSFMDGFGGGSWAAPSDPALASVLGADSALRSLLLADWEWRAGTARAKRTWLLQARPLGGGNTHVVMSGFGAGERVPRAGFAELHRAAAALRRYAVGAPVPPMPFLHPTSFGQLYESVLAGQSLPLDRLSTGRPLDLSHAIMHALRPVAGGSIFVAPMPPALEYNARTYATPAESRHLPIVAMIDLTVFGNAKDAFVLTPTHGFVKADDFELAFAWADVRGVEFPSDPRADALTVRIAPFGNVVLPAGSRAGALAQLFATIADIANGVNGVTTAAMPSSTSGSMMHA